MCAIKHVSGILLAGVTQEVFTALPELDTKVSKKGPSGPFLIVYLRISQKRDILSTSFNTLEVYMAHIYRIFNVVTEHFYIGSALKFKRRRWEHLDDLKKGKHHCAGLQAAWDEYGPDAFEFEILEEVPDVEALAVEDTYLSKYAGTEVCYNTALTTLSPVSSAPDVRLKIQQSMLRLYQNPANHPRTGKQHTEETKAKISEAKLANPTRYWANKSRSEETRKKIGDTQRGVSKGARTYTPEGLARAQENMRRNARENLPLDFQSVFDKFPKDVQERYDFSNAKYLGALVRIEGVVCEEHGEFSQYSAQFRKGRGCPSCGSQQRAQSKSAQMKEAWATGEGRELFLENRKKKQ